MTDERIETVLFEVNGKLASIDAKLDALSETIMRHESRITKLEDDFMQHISLAKDDDFKTQMAKYGIKAVIIALVVMASMTGGLGIVKSVFAM